MHVPTDAYRTRPDLWQTRTWARIVRRIGRPWVISRHVRRYCRPLTVTGRETLQRTPGPAIIIVNHSSHFDTPVALSALPARLCAKTAVAAAADRFYRRGKRGWWYSLFFNTFPIDRMGGGATTLEYPLSLLRRGWSVLIYPEGTRSVTGELGAFHHGVSFLAQQARVPVIPIRIEGLREVMPKGARAPRPAAVRVRLGAPIWLDDVESVSAGTARLEREMRALARGPGGSAGAKLAEDARSVTIANGGVMMTDHPNAALLRTAFDAFARRDLGTLERLFSDDAVWHLSGESEFAGDHHGRDAGFTMLRRLLEASAGTYRLDLHDVIANDDHAAVLTRATATSRGASIDLLGSHVYHVRAGRVTEAWWFWDDQRKFDEYFAAEPEEEALAVRAYAESLA